MESLVSIAKRLGIRPNPNMSRTEKEDILKRIYQEIRRQFPESQRPRDYAKIGWDDVQGKYYTLHKEIERTITNPGQFQSNYKAYEEKRPGIKIFSQMGGGFRWHAAQTQKDQGHERFAADIQLDSPLFPEMIKKLDAFILKHNASYKIPDEDAFGDRSDTLNLYLSKTITPEIAKEFIQIIRPCLSTQFDDHLNGRPLTENGQIIKGVRIGPEYKHLSTDEGLKQIHVMKEKIKTDINLSEQESLERIKPLVWHTSLGQKEAAIATLDLAYYLAGKEGQNPYQLLSYEGTPYHASLEITSQQSFQKKPQLSSFQEILKQMSLLQQEIGTCQKEINTIAMEQKRMNNLLK